MTFEQGMQDERPLSAEEIDWWHSIPLGVDSVTDGSISLYSLQKHANYIPDDLTGKTVLDIGAWDGYYSFVAEKRGAERVVAVDIVGKNKDKELREKQGTDRFALGTKGFRYAKQELSSDVEFIIGDILNLEFKSKFDVVICSGVLYHVPDPKKLLDILYNMTSETLILETAIIPSPLNKSRIYHHTGETNKFFDVSDEYVPTVPYVRKKLRERGFDIVDEKSQPDRSSCVRQVYDYLLPFEQHRFLPGRYIATAKKDG